MKLNIPEFAFPFYVRNYSFIDYKFWVQLSALFILIALLLSVMWPANLMAEDLLVNISTTENKISRKKARLYFSQRITHWPDGTSITLVVLPDSHPAHISFSKKTLGLYPYQLRRAWDRQLFTGTGQAPITVTNEQEARKIIAMTPGSLSYVSGDSQNEKIRQMEVH